MHNPLETLNKIQIRDIVLNDIKFHAGLGTDAKGFPAIVLWISADVLDVKTGERGRLNTSDNPRMLKPNASKTRTLNLAANILKELTAHEALEHFFFESLRIFGPHTDAAELQRICEKEEA